MTRCVSLLGLGFGDCGKGAFTDALCRRWQAHTVVRFNGGAQAGHNVVLPDGRQHSFSQFSAGTFVPGVVTVLANPVVVHPGALQVEYARLQAIGCGDAIGRLLIDRRCRVNTPLHQAAGRLRELARGAAAHGSCGVGVGETVRHALAFPGHALHYGDLARPALAMQKLAAIRRDLLADLGAREDLAADPAGAAEWRMLTDGNTAEAWLASSHRLLRTVPPAATERIAERFTRPGTVLFEGAQGVLLDEWHGFHPHTTWSSIHPRAVATVAAGYGHRSRIEHLGVVRAYLTRHGPGPFPTADATLDHLPEPHNSDRGWQGPFRRGHPDGVLLRYALAVCGRLDGLLVSHLDVFERLPGLRWCDRHVVAAPGNEDRRTASLPLSAGEDLAHQAALTRMLFAARPEYDREPLTSAASLLARLRETLACPVWFASAGPTHTAVKPIDPVEDLSSCGRVERLAD
ncbi:adenylosuccinate synthetase [Accumulibacter sp.]|uniref:adenylosuccinate synthetase n=1 Tax=Accumulibacter sp. TaxID=2053492 RepID=UPI002633882B|nr:adenylosuccinate synthetase [Accumulibacter sp.]